MRFKIAITRLPNLPSLRASAYRRLSVVGLLVIGSCGGTDISAVPTGYPAKSGPLRLEEAKKEGLDGIRYYLPMPYVLVKKPILLGSDSSESTTVTVAPAPGAAGRADERRRRAGAGAEPQPAKKDLKAGAPLGSGVDDEQEGDTSAATAKDSGKKGSPKPPTDPPADDGSDDGISIIMLPDFCQQQSLKVDEQNSKFDVELHFVDGWRLEDLKSSADSTATATALVDLAKTTLSSAKDVATAALGGGQAAASGGTQPQAAKKTPKAGKLSLHSETVTETWLRPGVYPLFRRDKGSCESPVTLDAQWYVSATVPRTRKKDETSRDDGAAP